MGIPYSNGWCAYVQARIAQHSHVTIKLTSFNSKGMQQVIVFEKRRPTRKTTPQITADKEHQCHDIVHMQ